MWRSIAPSTPSTRSSTRRSYRAAPARCEWLRCDLRRLPHRRRLAVEPVLLGRECAPGALGAPEMVLRRMIGGPLGKLAAGHRILQQMLRLLHGKFSSAY